MRRKEWGHFSYAGGFVSSPWFMARVTKAAAAPAPRARCWLWALAPRANLHATLHPWNACVDCVIDSGGPWRHGSVTPYGLMVILRNACRIRSMCLSWAAVVRKFLQSSMELPLLPALHVTLVESN